MTQTRLPHDHGALANHFADVPMDAQDIEVALSLVENGAYLGDLPVDVWQTVRQISQRALAGLADA